MTPFGLWLGRGQAWATHLFAFFLANGIAPAQIAMGIGLTLWLPRVVRSPREALRIGSLETMLGVFALVTIGACVVGVDPERSFSRDGVFKTVGLMLVYFWIRGDLFGRTPRYRHSLAWTFVAGAAVQAAIAVGEYALWQTGALSRDRVRGTLGMPLSLAELLSLGFAASLALSGVERPGSPVRAEFAWNRGRFGFGVAAALLTAAGLAFTFARGAWLAAAAGGALVAVWMRPRVRLSLAGGVGLVAILAAGVLAFTTSHLKLGERLASFPVAARALGLAAIGHPGAEAARRNLDESAAERIRMWSSGLDIVRDHPLGVGLRNTEVVYPAYRRPDAIHENEGHLHSNLLQIAVDRGWAGLAVFLGLFVAFGRRAWAIVRTYAGHPDPVAVASLGAVAAVFVAGLTEYDFGDSKVAMALWFWMALGANATSEETMRA